MKVALFHGRRALRESLFFFAFGVLANSPIVFRCGKVIKPFLYLAGYIMDIIYSRPLIRMNVKFYIFFNFLYDQPI